MKTLLCVSPLRGMRGNCNPVKTRFAIGTRPNLKRRGGGEPRPLVRYTFSGESAERGDQILVVGIPLVVAGLDQQIQVAGIDGVGNQQVGGNNAQTVVIGLGVEGGLSVELLAELFARGLTVEDGGDENQGDARFVGANCVSFARRSTLRTARKREISETCMNPGPIICGFSQSKNLDTKKLPVVD